VALAVHADSQRSRLVVNSAWMFVAQIAGVIAGGVVSIYAIRHLTTIEWGHYSTALALVAILTIVAGPGVSTLALREMSDDDDPASISRIFATATTAIALSGCVAIVLLLGALVALGYPHDVVVVAAVAAPFLILDPMVILVQAAFNAGQLLIYVAWFQVARAVTYCILAVAVVAVGGGIAGLAASSVATSAIGLVIALVLFRSRLHGRVTVSGDLGAALRFLRVALPIAGIGVTGIVYDRLDVILLSRLSTSEAVARYAVPYSLVQLTWIVPSVISAAFYPVFSGAMKTDLGEAKRLFLLVVRAFLFLSVPISLLLAVAAPTLVPFVFGSRYDSSAGVLAILVWTSVLGFQNYVLWYALLAIHKERAVLWIQLAGLIVNAAMNAALIPYYGAKGAAAALVISDLAVVAGQAILVHRHLFALPFARLVTAPLMAGATVVPLAYLIATQSAVLGAVLAAAGYMVLLTLARYITPEEWRPVLRRPSRVARPPS
jgi:O-antigen/teichoic acid export membrane protein